MIPEPTTRQGVRSRDELVALERIEADRLWLEARLVAEREMAVVS